MIEPLYCTQCGAEDFGCECEDPFSPSGVYCDVTGALDCDCEYCRPPKKDDDDT